MAAQYKIDGYFGVTMPPLSVERCHLKDAAIL